MTFARPTLEQLIQEAETDLATRLGLGPLQRRSVLRVLARVLAGLGHSSHGHLDYVADQVFPATSSAVSLEMHASLRGISRKAAAFAAGTATFTGTAGSTVPVGASMVRADGVAYSVTSQTTIAAAGSAAVPILADLPGDAGNATPGTVFNLQSAVPGVAGRATALEVTGGTAEESDEELRIRVLDAWRARPMAGTVHDYITWALEVPGVTRAWVLAGTPTLGQVKIQVVADGNTPTIEATTSQLAQVQSYIDERRPVTARARVTTPALLALDLTIRLSPATTQVRTAVAQSVFDAITRVSEPGGTIRLSQLISAIGTTPGEDYHTILDPLTDVVAPAGTLYTPGSITWA